MKNSFALLWRAFTYLREYGWTMFLANVKHRLLAWLRKHFPQALATRTGNIFEQAYQSLLKMSGAIADDADYVALSDDPLAADHALVRLIAFYLPQFHPIPENDRWWGRGFTEWTNVSKAVPQFIGHYQPHLPGELGFYDLRVPEVQKRQVELARRYGIHGFAFYYYWFDGKRLLDGPVNRFFQDKEIDFPYCLFWANENWTRRWDGHEDDVLIGQQHSPESDANFIRDITPFLQDDRYIRIDGKPVLMVYRVQLLPAPARTAQIWRDYCRKVGIGEIYLIAGQVYGFEDPRPAGFDAAVEFPPHNARLPRINHLLQILNPIYEGQIYRYEDLAAHFLQGPPQTPYELFKTVTPNWDNEPRRPGSGYTLASSTPAKYQEWLKKACEYTLAKDSDRRMVFINAWNEWAEGAHLEPDRRFGYAYLQATAAALAQLAHDSPSPS